MNGPQRTAVFPKEFLSYSLFGYNVGQDMEGQKYEGTNRRTISSSYFRQAVNSLSETINHC